MKNHHSFKVFIVEDDVWYGSMLQHYLSLNPEYEVSVDLRLMEQAHNSVSRRVDSSIVDSIARALKNKEAADFRRPSCFCGAPD